MCGGGVGMVMVNAVQMETVRCDGGCVHRCDCVYLSVAASTWQYFLLTFNLCDGH